MRLRLLQLFTGTRYFGSLQILTQSCLILSTVQHEPPQAGMETASTMSPIYLEAGTRITGKADPEVTCQLSLFLTVASWVPASLSLCVLRYGVWVMAFTLWDVRIVSELML